MDPVVTIREMEQAEKDGDEETAYDCAIALRDWCRKGGFLPWDGTELQDSQRRLLLSHCTRVIRVYGAADRALWA
jgi:hypothetical protein